MPDNDYTSEVLEMFDGGIVISEIAHELGMSTTTISRILKENNRDTKRKSRPVNEQGVVQAYQNNDPVPQILSTFDIDYPRLYRILKENDVPTRQVLNNSANADRLNKAVELYVNKAPLWQIKQETGVSQPTLHAELHKRNIQLRRPRML